MIACAFISEAELSGRLDLDGDGIARPWDCDDDDPTVGVVTWWIDADGDSYGSALTITACDPSQSMVDNAEDCDDSNSSVFPGADELCNGEDDDCDGETDEKSAINTTTWYADTDDDGYGDIDNQAQSCDAPSGYIADASDCDDSADYIHPGARDYCDGLDGDCNGVTDDLYWWEDADGDGWGSPYVIRLECEEPSGYVANNEDCNDTNPQANPEGVEVCDDVNADEDCDGKSDDADPDAAEKTTWYRDEDSDGWGDDKVSVEACDDVAGYVTVGGDCDDTDDTFSPGVAEIWYDSIDSDCDGGSDFDADADGWDRTDGSEGDPLDCDDTDALIHPDMAEACGDDIDNDCDGELAGACLLSGTVDITTADAYYEGYDDNTYIGLEVAGAGDVNGDGTDDVLLGSQSGDLTALAEGQSTGVVYLALGPQVGTLSLSSAHAELWGTAEGEGAGIALDGVGDLDGDGYADLAIGSLGMPTGGKWYGGVYIINGPVSSGSALLPDIAETIIHSETDLGQFGYNVSRVGDINGDNLDDVLLAGGDVLDGGETGSGYLVLGPATTSAAVTEVALSLNGTDTENSYFGKTLSGGGDINGDGLADVAIGAPSQEIDGVSSNGAVHVFLGPVTAARTEADAMIFGENAGRAGGGLASAGDTNGDGYADVVVGEPNYRDPSGALIFPGALHVIQGPITGQVALSEAIGWYMGAISYATTATAISTQGDVNGDGRDDILVGANTTNYWGSKYGHGGAYLIYGPISGADTLANADVVFDSTSVSKSLSYSPGESVAIIGDNNADGFGDLLIGSPYEGKTGNLGTTGAIYQFNGGGY